MQKTTNMRCQTTEAKKPTHLQPQSQEVSLSLSKSQTINPLSQSAPSKAELEQFFRTTMKSLIASNEAYFQNKRTLSLM